MPLARLFRGLAAALMTVLATPAAAGAIDEFPLPAGTQPGGITAGSDGALWFLEEGPSSIGRITTGGAVTGHFAVNAAAAPPDVSSLDQITLGPDGNLWFTQPADDQIGRMTIPSGAVTEYNVPNTENEPEGITVGPDGAIWFTAAGSGQDRPDSGAPAGHAHPRDHDVSIGDGDSRIRGRRHHRRPRRGALVHRGRRQSHRPHHDGRGDHPPRHSDGSQRAVGHHRRSGREALVRRGAGRSDRRDAPRAGKSTNTPVQASTHPRWRSARTGRSGSPTRIPPRA